MNNGIFLCCLLAFAVHWSYGQGRKNDSLIRVLDTVEQDDEVYRDQLDDMIHRYGDKSGEVKALWGRMRVADSVNEVRVGAILDRYGWLGSDVVGDLGNSTFFFVVQHSELSMQVKYLPMLRAAVKTGNAKARDLAYLEDRVALRQGRRQVYGSQIGWDLQNNWHYVLPLEDPEHVDQLRAAVGLPPLNEYLQNYNGKWDLGQYKRDLPKIDSLWKVFLKESQGP